MGLTKAQANARLGKITTVEELRALIKEIDTTGTGSKTLLWSGVAGLQGRGSQEVIHSRDMSSSLSRADSNLRTLESTEAAKFLNLSKDSGDYNPLLQQKLKELFKENPDGIDDFLYGPQSGAPQRRIGRGIWDEVSERFVRQASGDVRLVVGGAKLDRVFAQTELQALLTNPAVQSIEGLPIGTLRAMERTSGFSKVLQLLIGVSDVNTGMIQIQVDSQGRPIQNGDGTFRLDANDYMQRSLTTTRLSNGMRPFTEFIPDWRLLRHREVVEEISRLEPTLRSNNHHLEIDADPFHLPTVVDRVTDYAGKALDVVSLANMVQTANRQLKAGDRRKAQNTVKSWIAETAGGYTAARLAAMIAAPLMKAGPAGFLIGAGLIVAASLAGGDLAKKLYEKFRKRFLEVDKMASPLILDLDGNGVQTLGLKETYIQFDLDNNDFAEQTGWIDPGDGFLILDLNRNGIVDDGSELFGNYSKLANGDLAGNGFDALARYDLNNDARIDRSDPIWSRLRVWRDQNSNGISESAELLSLGAANVKAFNLRYESGSTVDANGNAHRQIGSFEKMTGGLGALNDVWFATDTQNSRPLRERAVSAAVASLPDLPGMGIVQSLHQAMMDPTNPTLRAAVVNWLKATRLQRAVLTQQLLFQWTKADHNPFSSPERRISSFDPLKKEKVAVVEKLMGRSLSDSESHLGPERVNTVSSMIQDIEFSMEMQLIDQWHVNRLLNLATSGEESAGASAQIDVTASLAHLRSQLRLDPDPAFLPMIQWLLLNNGEAGQNFFESLRSAASIKTDLLGWAMRWQPTASQPWNWIKGTPKADDIHGTNGDDFIEAGDGLDFMFGLEGNDTLHGGPNNDFFIGGPGGDTFHVSQNAGNGLDTVQDQGLANDPPDRVIFWELASTSVTLLGSNADVTIYSGSTKILVLLDQLTPEGRVEEFHFSDGVVWTHHNLMLQMPVQGSHLADHLIGVSDTSNRLQGHAGNDTLVGGLFPDHLEGGFGHDLLTGFAGADTLEGGEGNDTLEGGEGGDHYLFAANGGHDRIFDLDPRGTERDRVVFSNHRTTSLTSVQRDGAHLQLHFGSTQSLLLVNQLDPHSRIETFQFANGVTWDHSTLFRQVR